MSWVSMVPSTMRRMPVRRLLARLSSPMRPSRSRELGAASGSGLRTRRSVVPGALTVSQRARSRTGDSLARVATATRVPSQGKGSSPGVVWVSSQADSRSATGRPEQSSPSHRRREARSFAWMTTPSPSRTTTPSEVSSISLVSVPGRLRCPMPSTRWIERSRAMGTPPLYENSPFRGCKRCPRWCRRRDLNPHDLKRSLAPQASASANSATPTCAARRMLTKRNGDATHNLKKFCPDRKFGRGKREIPGKELTSRANFSPWGNRSQQTYALPRRTRARRNCP